MAISDTIRKGILSFKTSENEYTKFLPKTLANLVTTTSGTDVESKINELDDNIGDLDTITETDEDEIITKTYTTGFLSKLIDDVRTTVFNVTHAKAVWWNKLENKTVYDKIDGDCLQYENVVSDLDDMSAITEENAGKFVADARAVAELNSNNFDFGRDANGNYYKKYNNGLLECYGQSAVNSDGYANVVLPANFIDTNYLLFAESLYFSVNTYNTPATSVQNSSTNKAFIYVRELDGTLTAGGQKVNWYAVGMWK